MNTWLYVLIVVIVLLIWLYSKRSKAKSSSTNKHSSTTSKRKNDFQAISIQICPHACTAAKKLRDKRFLSSQAPMLPLNDCNVSDCKCNFVHHNDRRSHDDRRFTNVIMQNVFSDKEKREKTNSERRKK